MSESLPKISSVFLESFQLGWRHFIPLSRIAFWAAFPPAFLYFIFLRDLSPFRLLSGGGIDFSLAFLLRQALVFLLQWLLFLWQQMMVVRYLESVGSGSASPALGGIFQETVKLWKDFTGVIAMAVGRVLGWAVLFILPGIYFGIVYSLSGFVFLLLQKKGMAALKESRRLVENDFMNVGRCLVGLLALGVVVFFSLKILLSATVGMRTLEEFGVQATLGEAGFQFLYALTFQPYSVLVGYCLVKNLILRPNPTSTGHAPLEKT